MKQAFIYLNLVAIAGVLGFFAGLLAQSPVRKTLPPVQLSPISAPIPVQAANDNQCTAWLFDTNLKDAKKRLCGRK